MRSYDWAVRLCESEEQLSVSTEIVLNYCHILVELSPPSIWVWSKAINAKILEKQEKWRGRGCWLDLTSEVQTTALSQRWREKSRETKSKSMVYLYFSRFHGNKKTLPDLQNILEKGHPLVIGRGKKHIKNMLKYIVFKLITTPFPLD